MIEVAGLASRTGENSINDEGVADALGLPVTSRAGTPWYVPEQHLAFRMLQGAERDGAMLRVLREIHNDGLAKSGAERIPAWRRGWGEILEQVRREGLTYPNLKPQYFRHDVIRMDGGYAKVDPEHFEFAFCHLVKTMLYGHFVKDGDTIIDLGTGTASNIFLLLSMFRNSQVIGCDWAEQSAELTDMVGAEFGGRGRGARLDMLSLEGLERLGDIAGTVVLSVHAFEQLGSNYGAIYEAVRKGQPRLCIQIEPSIESYDENDLVDFLGKRYHEKRGYLRGYFAHLEAEAKAGRIEILMHRRIRVGNMVHDPYSGVVVWRPRD